MISTKSVSKEKSSFWGWAKHQITTILSTLIRLIEWFESKYMFMQYRRWRETGFQSSVDYPSVNSTGQLTANPVEGYRTMTTIMSELQILQNKAAKVLLGHPPRSSSTEALRSLDLKSLSARRFFNRCIAIYKCLTGDTDFNFNFIKNQAVHSYNTRRSHGLRLPIPRTNWGKHLLLLLLLLLTNLIFFFYN